MFIAQVDAVKEIHKMTAENVANYDETRVFITGDGEIRLEHRGKQRAQKLGTKGRTIGSLVVFALANGVVLMTVWIFKASRDSDEKDHDFLTAKFNIEEEGHLLRSKWPRFFAFTESGYSNKKLHAQIMAKFCELWEQREPNLWCWLFGDQLASHKSPKIVENSLEKQVMV